MNYAYVLLLVSIGIVLGVAIIIGAVTIANAYRDGIRDGYQNTHLEEVKKQVQEEGLVQGEEIALP